MIRDELAKQGFSVSRKGMTSNDTTNGSNTMKAEHTVEVRIGRLFESHWHVATYHILAKTREEARKLAGKMARRWVNSPMCRVKSGAINVRQ